MNLSISLIICYSIYSFFLFYQRLHHRNFRGASEIFEVVLGISTLVFLMNGLIFLIYYSYYYSFISAILLVILSFFIKVLWFPIEEKLGLHDFDWIFSTIGFIILPISAIFMWYLLP